jgi:hypothetical protein
MDISNEISRMCKQPLIVSEKSRSILTSAPYDGPVILNLSEIEEFLIPDRAVRFIDGHVEKDIDSIIFCTGYMYSWPFLRHLKSPVHAPTGARAQFLYQHMFYYHNPTLCFTGLPQRIVPFPISQAQSAVIARVYSGRLSLPSFAKMQAWEEQLIDLKGSGKSYVMMHFPLDAQYINSLREWVLSAPLKKDLDNGGVGKMPPFWDRKMQWIRQNMASIKMASRKLGSKRHAITTLEELGFDYETAIEEKDVEGISNKSS